MSGSEVTAIEAAQEAVTTLGLLRAEAATTIAALLDPETREHPRAIATAYRKAGEQVLDSEKRALGLRKNAFLSQPALAEITPLGLADPLGAHEVPLLRATFTLIRGRRVAEQGALETQLGNAFIGFKHETLSRECPACNRLDGRVTRGPDAAVLPPSDCIAGCTANYGIRQKIDYLADIN